MISVIRAKLHCIRVTGADFAYHGSITLDPQQCAKAGIFPLEFVNIWNRNNGSRISTYVIYGVPGSRCCILNGAAARTCQPGDELIIAASEQIDPKDLCTRRPRVLIFSPENEVKEVLQYRVEPGKELPYDFFVDKVE